jgi:hypothetical protein
VDAEIERRFAELGPWQSRFTIGGCYYGGKLPFDDDGRVDAFFAEVGEPASVLELGSLEGAHSIQIARRPFVQRLLSAEGREENVRRARFIMDILELENVEVIRADLEAEGWTSLGHFDATFCAGLLYHLLEPWTFLKRLRNVTSHAFIDTHYSPTGYVELGDYRGRIYREWGLEDVFSGLGSISFWPTLEDLQRMVSEAGFALDNVKTIPEWPNGPRAWLTCR